MSDNLTQSLLFRTHVRLTAIERFIALLPGAASVDISGLRASLIDEFGSGTAFDSADNLKERIEETLAVLQGKPFKGRFD